MLRKQGELMTKKHKILLLSGEGVQVVALARGLKKCGTDVSALCESKLSSGYCTRWLDHRYIAPSMITQKEKFAAFFYNHITTNKYDVIIPTADESAEFLSREKEYIESTFYVKCAIPSYSKYILASDKHKLMELCRQIGVGHPNTQTIGDDISSAAVRVGFPALIKPDFSAGARGIVKVKSIEELRDKYPAIKAEYGNCTLQQYVDQPDYYYNVMLYRDSSGEITGSTVIKIRRYFPLGGGTSCYSETVSETALVAECIKILEEIDWNGFADFDVLVDKHSGNYKIIEINPRVPSSLQAAYAAGVDFSRCYISDLFHEDKPKFKYCTNMQIRWFGLDVMWFLMSPNRFTFKPSWFKFWGKNVSYHDGSISDPLPMIAGCLEGIKKYLNPQFRKAKLKANK